MRAAENLGRFKVPRSVAWSLPILRDLDPVHPLLIPGASNPPTLNSEEPVFYENQQR